MKCAVDLNLTMIANKYILLFEVRWCCFRESGVLFIRDLVVFFWGVGGGPGVLFLGYFETLREIFGLIGTHQGTSVDPRTLQNILEHLKTQLRTSYRHFRVHRDTSGHLGSYCDTSGHLGTSHVTSKHLVTSQDISRRFWTLQGHLGKHQDTSGHLRTLQNTLEHLKTLRDSPGHFKTSWNISGTHQDTSGHLETLQNTLLHLKTF